jgi:L,D-peptidoglycan transpeptidase YkuD (ErfK/YbiS/YcfS/YnhG family)
VLWGGSRSIVALEAIQDGDKKVRADREPSCRTLLLMNRPAFFLFCFVPLVAACVPAASQPAAPQAFVHSTEMIVVVTPGWNAVEGRLQRFERADTHESWRPAGEPIAIVVGNEGMGWGIGLIAAGSPGVRIESEPIKREGDGKSPAGVFALGTAFGDAAQPLPGLKLPYLFLNSSIECVDDASSKNYNRLVDRSAVMPDWNSSEHMRDVGESYRWGIVIDHNSTVPGRTAPLRGGGSCVFLHIWRGVDRGTAGCTAMSRDNLESLLLWLDPARRPVLVQLPESAYQRLAVSWSLPQPLAPAAH